MPRMAPAPFGTSPHVSSARNWSFEKGVLSALIGLFRTLYEVMLQMPLRKAWNVSPLLGTG
jgi:hypothetical protein